MFYFKMTILGNRFIRVNKSAYDQESFKNEKIDSVVSSAFVELILDKINFIGIDLVKINFEVK